MATRAWRRKQRAIAQDLARQQSILDAANTVLRLVDGKEEFRAMEGLRTMLVEKVGLEKHLQQYQKKPVVVSVDRKPGGEWVYVVRGIRPPISFWGDHEIWFVRGGSHQVWAPTRKS